MWIARDKTGRLFLYYTKPKRHKTGWHIKGIPYLQLDKSMFPNLKWEDEPIEVVITEKPNLSLSVIMEETPDDTIVLTRYYEDYEKKHEWSVNMLKHHERYKDCTDEEVEEIWKLQKEERRIIEEELSYGKEHI